MAELGNTISIKNDKVVAVVSMNCNFNKKAGTHFKTPGFPTKK